MTSKTKKEPKYLLFDVETSSLWNPDLRPYDPKQAWIVQFAGFYLDEDLVVLNALDALVKPPHRDCFMSAQAYDVHGFTILQCEKDGISREKLRAFLEPVFKTDTVKLIAHNLKFDSKLLLALAKNKEEMQIIHLKANLGICTMEESRNYVKLPPTPKMKRYKNLKYKNPKLSELYTHLFGFDFPGAHDAQMDATATLACLQELVNLKVINL